MRSLWRKRLDESAKTITMKLSWHRLKIVLLVASVLASAAISVLAILRPNFFVHEVVPSKEPKSYGSFTLADLERQVPKNKDGHFKFDIVELSLSSDDIEVQKVLSEQKIETTGRIMFEPEKDSRRPLTRVYQFGPGARLLTPRRYSLLLEFATEPAPLNENAWVRVVGKPEYRRENGATTICLRVIEINPTKEPPVDSTLY